MISYSILVAYFYFIDFLLYFYFTVVKESSQTLIIPSVAIILQQVTFFSAVDDGGAAPTASSSSPPHSTDNVSQLNTWTQAHFGQPLTAFITPPANEQLAFVLPAELPPQLAKLRDVAAPFSAVPCPCDSTSKAVDGLRALLSQQVLVRLQELGVASLPPARSAPKNKGFRVLLLEHCHSVQCTSPLEYRVSELDDGFRASVTVPLGNPPSCTDGRHLTKAQAKEAVAHRALLALRPEWLPRPQPSAAEDDADPIAPLVLRAGDASPWGQIERRSIEFKDVAFADCARCVCFLGPESLSTSTPDGRLGKYISAFWNSGQREGPRGVRRYRRRARASGHAAQSAADGHAAPAQRSVGHEHISICTASCFAIAWSAAEISSRGRRR